MESFYKSNGVTGKKTTQILRSIRRVEADNDWDGVSAAVQVKYHYPKVEVNLSSDKIVASDQHTLVLDKATQGNGWVVDHHTTNPYKDENVLLFSTSGEIPTSRLTYIALGRRDDTGLFVSATAEITDTLHRSGASIGSIKELSRIAPYYFVDSKVKNQFLKNEEIYSMADILSIITDKRPNYAFRLGLRFYRNLPRNLDQLMDMLDAPNRMLVNRYREFVNNFSAKNVDEVSISGKPVKVIDRRGIGEFYVPAFEMMRRMDHGNYVIFKGNAASIRTSDKELAGKIIKRFESVTYGYGGRAGSFGIRFNTVMRYDRFKSMLERK